MFSNKPRSDVLSGMILIKEVRGTSDGVFWPAVMYGIGSTPTAAPRPIALT